METLTQFIRKKYPDGGSIQQMVNTGKNETVNDDILTEVLGKMYELGWEEIDNIGNIYPFGEATVNIINKKDMIKYITNDNTNAPNKLNIYAGKGRRCFNKHDNKFRSGGWVVDIKRSEETGGLYILYRPHIVTLPPFSIQLDQISRLFILTVDSQKIIREKTRKMRMKMPVYYKRPGKKTEFSVYLKDQYDNNTLVYYALSESKREKFTKTIKFKKAKINGWFFKD